MKTQLWDDERLARAALGSLLTYGATGVLGLAARLGPQAAWQRLKSGDLTTGEADQLAPENPDPAAAGQPSRPGRVKRVGGEAFAAWVETIDPAKVAEQTTQAGLRFLIPGDDEWPDELDELAVCTVNGMGGAPVGLWAGGPGHLAEWCRDAVALVGSRASTRYGEAVALRLASDLAGEPGRQPWTVVSGGAFGIDAASHRGALLVGGRTVAVSAGGLDVPYPPGNTALFHSIRQQGLAVSELPPGAHPTRHGFLARNRVIAALSAGTIIVEAAVRSGARNTASWAATLGRVVMAVPGPVTSAVSVTPHRLIRDGEATLVATADDVRALLQPIGESPELPNLGPARAADALSGDESVVREALPGRGGMTLSETALASGVPVPRCVEALHRLAERGLATTNEQGRWRACRQSTG